MKNRYRFCQDDDCHWYLIPADSYTLFNNLLETDEERFNEVFEETMLCGGIEGTTFTEPQEEQ